MKTVSSNNFVDWISCHRCSRFHHDFSLICIEPRVLRIRRFLIFCQSKYFLIIACTILFCFVQTSSCTYARRRWLTSNTSVQSIKNNILLFHTDIHPYISLCVCVVKMTSHIIIMHMFMRVVVKRIASTNLRACVRAAP